MAKSSIAKRIREIEGRTRIQNVKVYSEFTEPFDKYDFPNPVIEITRNEGGSLHDNPRLLSAEEVRERFADHLKLEVILKNQGEFLDRDARLRGKIYEAIAPELMKSAVMVVDERGRHLRIEIPMEDFERYSDPQDDREFDDQLLFNIREYGFAPMEAVALAGVQRWEKIKKGLKP